MSVASLYSKHQALATRLSKGFYVPGWEPDDVVQEARVALWEACRCFQPVRGVPFPPFATLVIKRRLRDMLRKALRNKQAVLTGADREYEARVEDLTAELLDNRDLIDRLCAQSLTLSHSQRRALLRIINGEPLEGKADDMARYRVRANLRKSLL